MSRIDVESKVKIYEVDGHDVTTLEHPLILVQSHWSRNSMVVLSIGDKKWTVLARDLEAAIRNGCNSGGV